MNPLAAQVAQPAGLVADEYGMKIKPVIGSTATECALLPVGTMVTSERVAASMTAMTGVHGDAALHAPPTAAFPLAVQRLSAP
jgi:hypothetical protein